MNCLQAAKQIQFLLQSRTWPDSPNSNVFGTVLVSQGTAETLAPSSLTFPYAIVRVLDSQADDDDQRYQVQRFEVVLLVAHTGDQLGEAAMVGGHRPSLGRSQGRGVLEIEEQALGALQFADPATQGFHIQLVSASASDPVLDPNFGYVVARSLLFQARLTTSRNYPAPNAERRLGVSVAGSNVTISWTWHERFDLHKAYAGPVAITTARGLLTLVRKAGGVAPTSVTDGTLVTLASNAATSVVDTPGSGTWSYALFAQYDEFGDATGTQPLTGTAVRTSTAATRAGVVV